MYVRKRGREEAVWWVHENKEEQNGTMMYYNICTCVVCSTDE